MYDGAIAKVASEGKQEAHASVDVLKNVQTHR